MKTGIRTGGDTIRIQKQLTRSYRGVACHMLRFYVQRGQMTDEEMSPATKALWAACEETFDMFDQYEEQVLRYYFGLSREQNLTLNPVYRTAERFGESEETVRKVTETAIREVLMKRGLVDE